jgi:hypothetical protein
MSASGLRPYDVDRRLHIAIGSVDGGDDAFIAGTLELVEARPVSRQIERFEDVDLDRRSAGIENERG